MINVSEIIERLKDHLGVKTNVALSDKLGVTKATVSNWVSRNGIDYNLILEKFPDMDMNWLLLGKDVPERGVATQELKRLEDKFATQLKASEVLNGMMLDKLLEKEKELDNFKKEVKELRRKLDILRRHN